MLPDVAGEERLLAVASGSTAFGVRDLELPLLEDEPCPAAAELAAAAVLNSSLNLSKPPKSRVMAAARSPVGAPPPCGFIEFQKKVWFHTCAALLKTPVFELSWYVALMISSSDLLASAFP